MLHSVLARMWVNYSILLDSTKSWMKPLPDIGCTSEKWKLFVSRQILFLIFEWMKIFKISFDKQTTISTFLPFVINCVTFFKYLKKDHFKHWKKIPRYFKTYYKNIIIALISTLKKNICICINTLMEFKLLFKNNKEKKKNYLL